MILNELPSSSEKVKRLYEYMVSEGLIFSSVNLNDSSPYAILAGKTSLGYRGKTVNWPEQGIVFFCAKDGKDKTRLSQKLGLRVYDNKDSVRPYAVFIPESKFEEAVQILKENEKNFLPLKKRTNERQTSRFHVEEDDAYEFRDVLDKDKNVYLVQDKSTADLLVKKTYSTYDINVFQRLRRTNISGIPRIVQLKEEAGKLVTYEEYIQGKNLLQVVEEEGVFSEDKIFDISIQLCEILKQMHSQNPPLLHRDIKPSNIMLRKNGKIVLIDFNASKEIHNGKNQDTTLFGTQYFAAPEQLTGYSQSNQTVDIYGFGATMSYLMTKMYCQEIIAPGSFHDVWAKCTDMSSANRYQTVEELQAAIVSAF